ncbi:MAG: 50S ribosomal protein L30 [Spirochaetes bacterium]|nr:50S ribosomal protein L30 [Spirochaetota bacterium]
MSKIQIKLVRSRSGRKQDQIGTLNALGLRKINQVREHDDNPVIRGMVFKVKHMVEVTEAK